MRIKLLRKKESISSQHIYSLLSIGANIPIQNNVLTLSTQKNCFNSAEGPVLINVKNSASPKLEANHNKNVFIINNLL